MSNLILFSCSAVAWLVTDPFKLIFILLSAASFTTFAQSTLNGNLADEQNKPLPYATVTLLNAADSALVKGALYDAAGAYLLQGIASGQYLPTAGILGYKKGRSATITVAAAKTLTLPPLQLQEMVKQICQL